MKLTDLIERHIDKRSQTVGQSSMTFINRRMAIFLEYLDQHKVIVLEDLATEVITLYQQTVEARKPTPKGQYHEIYEVHRFLRFLYEASYTLVNLAEYLPLPKISVHDTPRLTTEQKIQLIEKLDSEESYKTRDQSIAALFLFEQLTHRTIYEISILDLNLEENQIRITAKKKFIKIKPETLKYMRSYLRTRPHLRPITDWVFVDKRGKRIAPITLKRLIQRIKRLGVRS